MKFKALVLGALAWVQLNAVTPTEMRVLSNQDALSFAPVIHEWVTSLFRSYPYLYVAKEDETVNSHDEIYGKDPNAFVIAPQMAGKTVGMLTAVPMDSSILNEYFPKNTTDRIREKGFDPENIFYIGMFLIAPEYRQDDAFILSMYDQLVKSAKEREKTQICYIDMVRPENHPLKPASYISPEPWGETIAGFESMEMTVDLVWPTLQEDGSVKEEANTLLFYIKDI